MRKESLKISIGTAAALTCLFLIIWLFKLKSGDAQAQSALVGSSLCVLTLCMIFYCIPKIDKAAGPRFSKWVDDSRTRAEQKQTK